MIRSKWFILTVIITGMILVAPALYAGDPLPPNTEAKGKTISGTMSIILTVPPDDTDGEMVGVIVGACSKIPFQVGPIFDLGTVFGNLTEEDFSLFYFPSNPDADVCSPPPDYQGYAITGVKNWVKTTDAITAEVFLTPVVMAK